jgi:hypothetical protein
MAKAGKRSGHIAIPVGIWLIFCLLFAFRSGGLSYFTTAPLYQENYPKYTYVADKIAQSIAESGTFWTIDPDFAAGLLLSPGTSSISQNLLAVLTAATGITSAVWLRAAIALFFLAFPWLIYLGCRRLGLSVFASSGILLAELVLDFFSMRYQSVQASMGMFYTATPILFYCITRLATTKAESATPYKTMIWIGAAGTLLAYWHPGQAILLAGGTAAHVVLLRKSYFAPRNLPALALAPGIVITACWPWLSPLVKFNLDIAPHYEKGFELIGVPWLGWGLLFFYLAFLIQPVVALAAYSGIRSYRATKADRPDSLRFLFTFCGIAALLAILGTAGGFSKSSYPIRFLDPIPITLLAAAALAYHSRPEAFKSLQPRRFGAVFISALAVTVGYAILMDMTPRFQNTPPDQYRRLSSWLESETDLSARIAFEGSGKSARQPYGFDPSSVIAMDVKRHYVSVPSTETANVTYLAYLYEGRIGYNDLSTLPPLPVKRLMRQYNIGWVVACTEKTKNALRRFPELFEPTYEAGGYQIYRVAIEHDYFLRGKGKVNFAPDRIELTDLEPAPNGDLTLSFHHFDSLRSEGAATLSRAESQFDSIGFLSIKTEEKTLTILSDTTGGVPGLPEDFSFEPDTNKRSIYRR